MLLSFVAFGLLFAWLLVHRYRVEVLEDRFEDEGFAVAIAERRAEGRRRRPIPPDGARGADGRAEPAGPSVNDYVAGGWGAAALIVVLYAWRTLRRGRVLAPQPPGAARRRGADHGSPGAARPSRCRRAAVRRRFLGSRRRQVVAGLVIAGALAFLLSKGLNNATVYFKTADQAVADKASLGTRQFRIEGTVEPDVRQVGRDHAVLHRRQRRAASPWSTAGSRPSCSSRASPSCLKGHWQGPVYASDQIMVKHTASYTEAHPDRLKSQLPAESGDGAERQ